VSLRFLGAIVLAGAALAGSGCATGTIYHRGTGAAQIQMREPRAEVFELRRGERIKVTCTDGEILRGYVVGLESEPESLLIVAVPEAEYTDQPETLGVPLREVRSLWVPGRSERAVGGVLFATLMIVVLLWSTGYGFILLGGGFD
jgi:hypothetical protein